MTALSHCSLHLSILFLSIDLLLSSSECNLSCSQPSHKALRTGQITVKKQTETVLPGCDFDRNFM